MTIYSLDVLLFLFGTSLLFHVLFCCFLTCIQISQEADQVVWCSHLFQNFPQFIVIHTVKGFGIVSKAEIDVFLELSCFFYDPANVGNLVSGSSAFSKTSLHLLTWGVLLSVSYHFVISYCSWGSQGKNTEVVCHSLLQWTTFCQTSPPWPTHLAWPHGHGLVSWGSLGENSYMYMYESLCCPPETVITLLISCSSSSVSYLVVSDSCQLQPTRFLCPWNSPGKNTGVDCHSALFQYKIKSLIKKIIITFGKHCKLFTSFVNPKQPRMLVCLACSKKCWSHLTLRHPMDPCSSMLWTPCSSVHGVLQARILEWVATPFSRGSSWPRNWTWVSCIVGRFFTIGATREEQYSSILTPWSISWCQESEWLSLNSGFRNLLKSVTALTHGLFSCILLWIIYWNKSPMRARNFFVSLSVPSF